MADDEPQEQWQEAEEGFNEDDEAVVVDEFDVDEELEANISCQVANDHDLIKGLYKRLRAPGLSNDERQALVWEMVRLLDAHVAAEEAVLCPALAKEMGEGVRQHALAVDSSLKLLIGDLSAMRVTDPGFPEKVNQLMAVFFEHMAEEEHLLPELRGAVGVEELVELGGRFKAVREGLLARAEHAHAAPLPA